MERAVAWAIEGFVLDDAGNLIGTTYIDLRSEEERTAIPALVKGCRREHALEDGETVLISKPARFRQYGERLIQDIQEGFAKEESETVMAETAAQAARRRAGADMNEAIELSGSQVRRRFWETHRSRSTESKSLTYGDDWWIFSTSIEPREQEWDAWRATLPNEYDHVSEIGQPAKFAEALARMVAEQIGPQGKDAWLRDTTEGADGPRTKHRSQQVIHGPVIYTDRVYDQLIRDGDPRAKLAAAVFTKGTEYAAQREYRFAVLTEGNDAETVELRISGMMRDALKRRDGGLVRNPPAPAQRARGDEPEASSRTGAVVTPTTKRTTITNRQTEREEKRWETRTPDGQVTSSEGQQRERVIERIVTQDHQPDDDSYGTTEEPAARDHTRSVGRRIGNTATKTPCGSLLRKSVSGMTEALLAQIRYL